MEENPPVTGMKNKVRYDKKQKIENDPIKERVMAILTANKSCSCQESFTEQCYIHGQPAKFEVYPSLWAERKEKNREHKKNLRKEVRQKERLLIAKPTEDLTPKELEMIQKIKEKRMQHNLYQKNRYHSQQKQMRTRKEISRQQKTKEDSLQETEEVKANNNPFVPLLNDSFVNENFEPLDSTSGPEILTVVETPETSKAAEPSITDSAFQGADDNDAFEIMKITERQTSRQTCKPRELAEVQRLRRSEAAKRRYHEMGEDKKREKIRKGTEYTRRRRQKIREEKARNAHLGDVASSNNDDQVSDREREDKIRQNAKIRQQTFREKERLLLKTPTESLTPEELEMVEKIKERKGRQNLYLRSRYHSLTVEQRREMNARKNALKKQKAREKSLRNTDNIEAKNAQNDQLQIDSFSINNVEPIEVTSDPEVLTAPKTDPEAVNASNPDSASHDSNNQESNKNMDITESQHSENNRKRRLEIQEKRDNNVEPLDEKNLKMLLDIIQSLGPTDQGQVEPA